AFASALDPRFKALTIFGDVQRNEILNSLKDQYNLLKQQEEEEQISSSPIQPRSVRLPLRTSFSGQNNIFDDLFDNLQQFKQEQAIAEPDRYTCYKNTEIPPSNLSDDKSKDINSGETIGADAHDLDSFKEAFQKSKRYPYTMSDLEYLSEKTILFLLNYFQQIYKNLGLLG
ncbi:6007_t:CDS:2, partial [Entrophospora sp. SA101]